MIYLSSFMLSNKQVKNPNIYPYNVFRGKYIFSHEDRLKLLHFSVQCAKLKEYEVIVHGYASERINF